MEIIKENENIELINNGKHLNFSLNDLNFLKLKLTDENKDRLWIYETFEVEKKDKDIYKMIDSLFFSYGREVYFDTEIDSLILRQEEDKYKFCFYSNFNRNNNELCCEFIDYTTENNSMENLFLKFQELESTISKTPTKKLIKKVK